MTGQRPGDTPRAVLSVSCRQSHNLNATATASATPLRLVAVSQRGVLDRRPVIGASGDLHRHTQRVNIAQRHIGAAIDEGVAVERPTLVQTSCTDYDQRDATSG